MRSGASQINFFQAPCARLGATWQRRQGGDAASTLRSEATAEDGLRRPRPRSAGGTNLGSVHSSHIRRAAARGAGRRSPSSPSSVAGLLRRMGVAALRRVDAPSLPKQLPLHDPKTITKYSLPMFVEMV